MDGAAKRSVRVAALSVAAFSVSACSTLGWQSDKPFVPEAAGLYALSHEGPQRLDGDHDWQVDTWEDRESLPPDLQFVVAEKALQNGNVDLDQAVTLRKLAWVRSRIDSRGRISPSREGRWHETELLSFEVPVKVQRMSSNPGIVRVNPSASLDPGLYALTIQAGGEAIIGRFGVQWPSVDKNRYAADHCVDRYSESKPFYRPCAAQVRVRPADGLQVYLVHPDASSKTSGGKMLIEGVIANTSKDRRIVPTLQGELKSADGKVVKRWEFNVTEDAVNPGEFRKFQTIVDNPPNNAVSVDVHVTPVRTHGLNDDSGSETQ